MDNEKETKETSDSGTTPKKRGRRTKVANVMFKKRTIVISIVLCLLCLAGGYYFSSFESTDDAFIEGPIVRVSPKVSGIIEQLHIDDNQDVKQGELLLQIEDQDYKVRYDQAKSAYETALYKQKIAKADEKSVSVDLDLAKQDLERYQSLYEKGAVSKQELDRATSKYELSKARMTGAKENVLSKTRDKVADAQIDQLRAAMEQAELQLSYTKIYAAEDGRITNRSAEMGAFAHAGAPLFSIVPEKRWVIANFKETQLNKMQVGQSVKITVDAYPKLTLQGKIDSFQWSTGSKTSLFPPENAVGSYVKVVQRVPVKIVFTEKPDARYSLAPGMSVVPKVRVR